MDSNLLYTAVFLIVTIACYYVFRGKTGKKIKKLPPQPGRQLPIIGHLHIIPKNAPVHQSFADMADEHGPLFSLRLGTRRDLVVVNRWEEVKECFTVNDKAFLSRPINSVNYLLGYDLATFGNAPYGEFWRWMRKLTMQELLSSRQADLLRDKYESEIRASMKDLHRRATRDGGPLRKGLIDFKRWCKDVMFDVMFRLMVGKRGFSYSGEYSESRVEVMVNALKKFVYLNSNLPLSDAIGLLWWSDFEGHKRSMKETAREFDEFLSEWLEEHRRKRNSSLVKPVEDEDLMDIMLSLADSGQLPNHFDVDTCIKATMLEYLVDAVETVGSVLTWTITEIAKSPSVLKNAQEELDQVVGRHRWLDESDTSKIPYVWAVIKESLRLHPPSPMLAPREAVEDCTIGGYDVPKGTMLFINAWKVMKDPRVWPEPLEFRPERFLESGSQMDVRGQHFHLIPFGSGRRSCGGKTFALRLLPLIIGGVVQGFDLTVPIDKPIDETEAPVLSLSRAHPLEIEVTPRLRADMYV